MFYEEFGSLTQAQLLEKVRALQNLAYRLGVEEGKKKNNFHLLVLIVQVTLHSKRNE